MNRNDYNKSSWPLPSGGNAQDLMIGPSRRRREPIGQPRPPPRDDQRDDNRPPTDDTTEDPLTQGFAQIMARFDKLESRLDVTDRRVENLETPLGADPDPPYDDLEEEGRQEGFYRGSLQGGRAHTQRNIGQGFRERDRRGDQGGGYPHHEYQRGPRNTTFGERVAPWQPRTTSCWDPPAARQHPWPDQRQPTCWDAPYQRDQFQHTGSDQQRGIKMNAPHFDGTDATNWISRVQYYFDHLMMPETDRLHYVVMLFDPPAAEWIFNYRANNRFVTWPNFLEDVRHRFDPQSFQNYIGLLSKLVQTSSVAEYHATFERYLNRVEGLSETTLIPMFIAGLKQPIQEKVELQQPTSLAATMALALRLAANQESRSQQATPFQRRQWSTRESRSPASNAAGQPSSTPAVPATGQPSREQERPRFPPIRVSQAEKAERSRKGLCWHCPDKYAPGHVCSVKLLCYVGDDDEGDQEELQDSREHEDQIITADLSHLHEMNGNSRSTPFHVVGSIGSTEVRILIDTGSSHDFLHPRIAEQLKLSLTRIRPFRVYVGNGASLLCSHVSRGTKLTIQGACFVMDLHILEIHGPDIILGMAWLESLGKVAADFVGKTLEFKKADKTIFLKGTQLSPKSISLQSLADLASYSAAHEFYEIIPLDTAEQTATL